MCGIVGFLQPAGFSTVHAEKLVGRMASEIAHRGPDDSGVWLDGRAGVALGHTRLSIVDLSSAGHQPMVSASGRYTIALNGEIYNHAQIRKEIQGSRSNTVWRGHSDTETLLSAIDCWGIERTLTKSVGMFAFVLWDRQEQTLTLARDRLGEKPLYYGWQGDIFLFGSELKALRAHPSFLADIDRDAVAMYLRRGYISAPRSIYQNIHKLQPGTSVQLSASSGRLNDVKCYWSLSEVIENAGSNRFVGTDAEAIDELEAYLTRAIAQQSIADVPLGAFLSGGIDSSTVVSLMQSQSAGRIKTFTIGFQESGYDEAVQAKAIADHLGTDHNELYVTPKDAMDIIPCLHTMYDEPFGDSSAIPTALVSRLARQQVKVSLSGDGGDELFGGYRRYQRTADIWAAVNRIPRIIRKSMSYGFRTASSLAGMSAYGWKADRLAHYLSALNWSDVYSIQTQQFTASYNLVVGPHRLSPASLSESLAPPMSGSLHHFMMVRDALGYLPDDILVKVDRAAMSTSLETRMPMLDHRVVELAWSLPIEMKLRHGQGKWVLRKLLERHVPLALIDRRKSGFSIPVGEWLKGPLRDWAEQLLSTDRLRRDGILNTELVRSQWSQHLKGQRNCADSVWALLMFQAWMSSLSS